MIPRAAVCCCAALLLVAAGASADPPAESPEGWIGRLAAEEFQERERAAKALAAWADEHAGEAGERFFLESIRHADPEVRMRCRELLRRIVVADFRRAGQGYVGIQMGLIDVPDQDGKSFGVRIAMVLEGTPAAAAGLQVGDVIFQLNGKRWEQPDAAKAFQDEVKSRRPGDRVRLGIRRAGEAGLIERAVELARRPDAIPLQLMPWQGQQVDPLQLQRDEEDRYFKEWYARRLGQHQAARQ
jgi:predicted metalloprotease with PDZ domain